MKLFFNPIKNFFKKKLDAQSKKLFKNSFWVLVSNLNGSLLAFVRSIIMARGLGVEIFGLYNIIVNLVLSVLEFFNLNIGGAIIRYGAIYKNENRIDKLTGLVKGCVIGICCSFSVAIFIIGIMVFFFNTVFFNAKGIEWYVISYSFAAAITILANSMSLSLLRLFFKFKINSIIVMIMDYIELIIVAGAIFFYPRNLTVFFMAMVLSKLLNGMVCTFAALYEMRNDLHSLIDTKLNVIGAEWPEIRGFVITNSLGATVRTFINKGDLIVLGILSNAANAGYYSIAKKLAFLVLTLTDPLQTTIYPQLSKLVAEKKFDAMRRMLVKTTKLFLYPSIPVIVILFFAKEWIIKLIYGSAYLPASQPFFFLLIVSSLLSIFFWGVSAIQSIGEVRFRLWAYLFGIAGGGFTSWLIVPSMGATGAAISLLVAYLIIHSSFLLRIHFKLKSLQNQDEI